MRSTDSPADRFEQSSSGSPHWADDEQATQGPLFGTLERHSGEGRFKVAAALTALAEHEANR
jgi:hypothetical protein